MHVQSADEIQRQFINKFREDYIVEHVDKSKRQEQIDWSTENNVQDFTFDIRQMATCTQLYKTSI